MDDVDQCDDNYGICHNTNGSYYCSCIVGFRLASDGLSCLGEKKANSFSAYIYTCILSNENDLEFHFVVMIFTVTRVFRNQ